MSRGTRTSSICLAGCLLSVFTGGGPSASAVPPFLHQGKHVAKIDRTEMLALVEDGEANVEIVVMTRAPLLRRGFHDILRFGSVALVDEIEASASLIQNGSFELADKRSPAKGWYFPRDPEQRKHVTVDTTTYRDGGRSLRISDVPKSLCITQYLPAVESNTRYHLTYFVKLKDVERREGVKRYGACVNLSVSPKDGQNLFFPPTCRQGTLAWTKQGVTFRTGPNAGKNDRPYARLYLYGTQGTVWFDDVRLRRVDE